MMISCVTCVYDILHLSVPKPLMELHVKLLRKMGKYVSTDRWEKYLAKVRDTRTYTFSAACDCRCHSQLHRQK